MKRQDRKTNDMLAQVVGRLLFHKQKAMEHGDSVVGKAAQDLCNIEIYEMYLLSQEGYWHCEGCA